MCTYYEYPIVTVVDRTLGCLSPSSFGRGIDTCQQTPNGLLPLPTLYCRVSCDRNPAPTAETAISTETLPVPGKRAGLNVSRFPDRTTREHILKKSSRPMLLPATYALQVIGSGPMSIRGRRLRRFSTKSKESRA